MELFIVFLGGSIGAALRYLIYILASSLGFPYGGTFSANILGCFAVGFLMSLESDNRFYLNKYLKLFILTGIIGSFTTFSTYSYETMSMLQKGNIGVGLIYLSVSLFIGMVAILCGICLEKYFVSKFKQPVLEEDEEICKD